MIIFSLGLILSHYTSGVIFFFIVAFGYLAGNMERTYKQTSRIEIQKSFLALILVVIFLWYVQICETRFDQGAVYATKNVIENFGNFFVEETRPEGTLQIMGIGIRSLGDSIYSFSHYLISLLIALGTCFILYENVRGTEKKWVSNELTSAHLGMVAGAVIVLTSMVLLPHLSNVYTLDRMWSQAMILLSLSYIFGGVMLAGRKESRKALIFILIMTLFLYANNSYLIYQFLGEQRSLVLNSVGPDFAHFYVHDPEIAGALWLANMTKNESLVYSDASGGVRLSYGNLRDRWNTVTFFRLNKPLDKGNYLYLNYVNVILNIVYMGNNYVPLGDYSHLFAKSKKTYDNGNAIVFFD
ncbi:MAG: DUF2206 domain-containing protein [Methanotrichaceae archaeon]|nr:DUF2206 domain-containing protein [Methanotrichaceae archaeon]